MRGRRLGKTGGVFAGIHGGFFRAENDADGRGSFAAVERSMSDRLLEPWNQKMAFTNSRMLRCISGSSVIGRAIATSQARSVATPCRMSVPA